MNIYKRNKRECLFCLFLIFYGLFILSANAQGDSRGIYGMSSQRATPADISLQPNDTTMVQPWNDPVLWDSFLKTKTHASFSVKIHDTLPEFNFKIVGKMKGKIFHPSHVEIYNTISRTLIHKLPAKNRFTNAGHGWDAASEAIGDKDIVWFLDVNFDGYLDLRLLSLSGGASGQSVYATYLYVPSVGKFRYHRELSKLSGLKVDSDSKLITSYSDSGAFFYSKGYYSITENKLYLSKIEWTERDMSRDKGASGNDRPCRLHFSHVRR
jgi:hypothetical protein